MEISIKKNHGFYLVFEADNVKVEEDIEDRIYFKKDGKTDFSITPKRDIKTEALSQLATVMDDMIYYRIADFDSSDLIEHLFEKLPENIKKNILIKLERLTD